jgi:hypothetical protein
MQAKPFIPARLEVRTEHGSAFVELSRILRDPDLQDRCLERRELKRVMKILQERGALPEQARPKPAQPKRRRTSSPSSKHR